MTTTLVTGANRGIGRAVATQLAAHGHHVLLGCRRPASADAVVAEIEAGGGRATPVAVDLADDGSIDAAVAWITDRVGGLDALVNNAAITYDTWQRASAPDFAVVREALETNLWGTWRLTVGLLPLVTASPAGRIVNVSSGAGAMDEMGGSLPAYRVSKVSLNALTRMWASENPGVLVNAVCPGWVATDMGGGGGRPVAEGAAGIVWAATLPSDGPTGGFFRDGEAIAW
ncbi:MAG: SDR family NAD(P)-dependent oxidoreductase [Actinomycetota bacterium]